MASYRVNHRIRRLAFLVVAGAAMVLGLWPNAVFAQSFANHAFGHDLARHVIVISGEITAETPSRFVAWLNREQPDGYIILLDGDGADPRAGMALGQIIRDHGFETEVGRVEYSDGKIAPGRCFDACALAFLGGQARRFSDQAFLGFQGGAMLKSIASPQLSADFVTYLIAMDVDVRLYAAVATHTGAVPLSLSRTQSKKFRIITPDGFSSFELSARQKGIAAYAQRVGTTRPFDTATGMGVICAQAGGGEIWVEIGTDDTASHAADHMSQLDGMTIDITDHNDQRRSFNIPVEDMFTPKGTKTWHGRADETLIAALGNATRIETRLDMPKSFGAVYTSHQLVETDRHAINAVLAHCE
ncbi:hypothetical protein [Sulfitobacter pontiacus]|uniref:hypothetical protein n=1 Tax=Sulfitobacter pontiacus TaxID=60137 RepID=UPI001114C7CE|nr:hypothetical protein [Sulfitobacter pontiacus]